FVCLWALRMICVCVCVSVRTDTARGSFIAELDHCHTNGGYCVRAICPPSARRPGSCFPEKVPCCKYMK
uniref:Beta-defensin-like domain-containing protein n=1 Tax=Mus spicilegus TaxID=10103 RepID=A0A8C6GBW2_MUSSI